MNKFLIGLGYIAMVVSMAILLTFCVVFWGDVVITMLK